MTIQIANCSRCGVRCVVKGPIHADARLLQYADKPEGYCVPCAVTAWFKTFDQLSEIMDNPRCQSCGGYRKDHYGAKICRCDKPKMSTPQEMISLPHVQAIFAQILAVGHADVTPDEIDWLEVAANWDLPLPEKPRRKRRKKDDPRQGRLLP